MKRWGLRQRLSDLHRDDFTIFKDERELSKYGDGESKGCRSLVETCRALSMLKKRRGSTGALLLDDIFSELDEKISPLGLDVIGKQQTIITWRRITHGRLSTESKECSL